MLTKKDRKDLRWAMKVALLEQSKKIEDAEAKQIVVEFVKHEATYEQLLNLTFNPFDSEQVYAESRVLENVAMVGIYNLNYGKKALMEAYNATGIDGITDGNLSVYLEGLGLSRKERTITKAAHKVMKYDRVAKNWMQSVREAYDSNSPYTPKNSNSGAATATATAAQKKSQGRLRKLATAAKKNAGDFTTRSKAAFNKARKSTGEQAAKLKVRASTYATKSKEWTKKAAKYTKDASIVGAKKITPKTKKGKVGAGIGLAATAAAGLYAYKKRKNKGETKTESASIVAECFRRNGLNASYWENVVTYS